MATAAARKGQLSEFAAQLRQAGLTRTLDAATGITVFAPTNDAYGMVPADGDPATAGYLVVPETLAPATLAGTHRTLEGSALSVVGSGHDFRVDSTADVVCGKVRTANATRYFVDALLIPRR